MKKTILPFFAFALFLGSIVVAQENAIIEDSLFSNVLQEQRKFQVQLPAEYSNGSAEKYSVLYLLDGDGNNQLAAACHKFIKDEGYMPPIIIVSIYNVDRNRDFLPSHNDQVPTSGGAANFLKFIKEELIPYVDAKFPANQDNMIYGHSFGGVFSMYALLNEPLVFNTYIAVDPSFWWDNKVMPGMAVEKLQMLDKLKKALFVSGREGQPYEGMGINVMDSVLKAYAPESLDWKSVAYPDESHGSVRYKSIYDALRFAYEGFRSTIEFHPQAGIMLTGKPIEVLVMSDHPDVRYTTDGKEPTDASPKIEQFISMPGPGSLRVKSFSKRGGNSNEIIARFESGEVVKGKKLPKKYQAGGLNYRYYEGSWDSLPDFSTMKAVALGKTSKDFTISSLPKDKNFGCVFDGYIEIKQEGYYIFGLDSDDGAKMYLNDKMILDNDGLHATGNAKSYIIPLESGFYPVSIEYFQKEGGAEISLVYLTPGVWDAKPFPTEQQYFKE